MHDKSVSKPVERQEIDIDARTYHQAELFDELERVWQQHVPSTGVPAEAAESPVLMRLHGLGGRNHCLMAIDRPWQLVVAERLGHYAFAFNRQASVLVEGSVGDGCGEGMLSGAVRVRGDAGSGAGTALCGGTLAIYGSAGRHCGAAMRGGEIFIRGDVGPEAAAGALWGTIVIGGDAGAGLGDLMRGATVFIRGEAASLGRGVQEAPLREREKLRLGLLLINAGIRGEVRDFRRIVSEASLREESAKRTGEVNPSWR